MLNRSENKYKSALYRGWLGHRRFSPRYHAFKYKVFMCYLDLDELEDILEQSPFWSVQAWSLARFKRSDYLDGGTGNLKKEVQKKIARELKLELNGPVRVLTNLRYFGFIMNPLTIYYCFDENEKLRALLLEVTNTPWGERHHYALACDPDKDELRTHFGKQFHVSPFHDMNIKYEWLSSQPGQNLMVHMKNLRTALDSTSDDNILIFDASLNLERYPINAHSMNYALLTYPFMTLKVFTLIYWQAIKLFFKRIPVYSHPTRTTGV